MARFGPRPRPVADRFWEKVEKGDGCWTWVGTRTGRGYGTFRANDPRRQEPAHRLSWEFVNGPIPDGLSVLHHCDNPPCVRPDHLFLGTRGDNNRDAAAKGRTARGDRHGYHLRPAAFRKTYGQPIQSRELVDLVHALQPACLVNGRIGNALGDYAETGDNLIPGSALPADWSSTDRLANSSKHPSKH
jgi:hypothetical protein